MLTSQMRANAFTWCIIIPSTLALNVRPLHQSACIAWLGCYWKLTCFSCTLKCAYIRLHTYIAFVTSLYIFVQSRQAFNILINYPWLLTLHRLCDWQYYLQRQRRVRASRGAVPVQRRLHGHALRDPWVEEGGGEGQQEGGVNRIPCLLHRRKWMWHNIHLTSNFTHMSQYQRPTQRTCVHASSPHLVDVGPPLRP